MNGVVDVAAFTLMCGVGEGNGLFGPGDGLRGWGDSGSIKAGGAK